MRMRESVRVWAGLPSVAQQLQARRSKLFNLLCALVTINVLIGSATTKQAVMSGGKIMTVILWFKPVILSMLPTDWKPLTSLFSKMISL